MAGELGMVKKAARMIKKGRAVEAEEVLRGVLAGNPRQVLGYKTLASLFLFQGKIDSAVSYFQKAIRLAPGMADAHHGLGLAYTIREDYEEASSAFEQAIELDAGHPAFFFNSGLVYEYRGKYDEARQAFEDALVIDPFNHEARSSLGGILLWQKKSEEALEQYGAACRLAPGVAENWYGMGKAYASLGQDSLAIACLEAARERDGEDARVHYQLGMLYRKAGRLEVAQKALVRFQTLKGDREERAKTRLKMPDPDAAQGQFDLGMLYRKCGRPAEAVIRFYRALRLGEGRAASLLQARPNPIRMERAAGLEAMHRKEYRLAINHYRTASQLEPGNGLNYRNLGLALRSLGKDDQAMAMYRKAIDLDPELAPAYNDLALLYAQNAEDYETAIQLLNRAIGLDLDEKLFHFNLAHIHFTIGRFDEAVRENERVLELDSLSALTWFNLGMSHSRLGNLEKAEASLRKALEINSSYADAFYELGKLYKGEGRLAEAGEMYESCLKYQARHKYAHYGLGQVYLKMGRKEEARELLDRFAELREHRKQEQYLFFAPPDSL